MEKMNNSDTFINPILASGADPWVVKAGEYYYLCGSDGDRCIYLTVAQKPQEFRSGLKVLIFQAPEGTDHSHETWAPELHYIMGNWYIYYAADHGHNEGHRMHVLQGGRNVLDPLEEDFRYLGKIADATDRWAIDGTVLTWKDQLYFIWSGWEGIINERQNLYIAPMENPWTITGDRVCISSPDREWELHGEPLINEGPEILIKGDKIHIIYSASGSWTDDYCLGRLTCNDGNVLDPKSWVKIGPVFSKTDEVYGPGHASFIRAEETGMDFIVYHAARRKGAGWDRDIRMQSFSWKGEMPVFGSPISAGIVLQGP